MSRCLVIGSRGSKLALWQAEQARLRLIELNPQIEVRIQIIKTTGDVKNDPLSVIGGRGVFTKELEDALLDGRIDIAVHSFKDLPTVLPKGLSVSAVCEREDPRDALVLRPNLEIEHASLAALPLRGVVGTSSPRRLAQLKALRGDLEIKDLRGNVDTRIRKLDEGQYDAVILATAGLVRLGLQDRISVRIDVSEMLPAVGQGAVAIEVRDDNVLAFEATEKLSHYPTRVACRAERAFLRVLGGGCQLPIAAHAIVEGDSLTLDGLVARTDGSEILRGSLSGSVDNPDSLGLQLAEQILAQGAEAMLNVL